MYWKTGLKNDLLKRFCDSLTLDEMDESKNALHDKFFNLKANNSLAIDLFNRFLIF